MRPLPVPPVLRILQVLFLMLGPCIGFATAAAAEVKLGGTGAALATMQALAGEALKLSPPLKVTLVPNLGTSGGIKALRAGAIDVALATHGASAEERAAGLTHREYARTPFVLAARRGADLPLNAATIAEIYSGGRATWPDGTPFRLVLRQANDSDMTTLMALAPEVKSAVEIALKRPGMIVARTDQDAADRIASLPGGVGTTTLALLFSEKRPLDAMPLDGVKPSVKALENGSYRLAKSLYFVFRADSSEPVRRFLALISSEAGRRILRDNGQLPL